MFDRLKAEYDEHVKCTYVSWTYDMHHLVERRRQRSLDKRFMLLCPTGPSEKGRVGRLALWTLPKRFPKACQNVWLLPRQKNTFTVSYSYLMNDTTG